MPTYSRRRILSPSSLGSAWRESVILLSTPSSLIEVFQRFGKNIHIYREEWVEEDNVMYGAFVRQVTLEGTIIGIGTLDR